MENEAGKQLHDRPRPPFTHPSETREQATQDEERRGFIIMEIKAPTIKEYKEYKKKEAIAYAKEKDEEVYARLTEK